VSYAEEQVHSFQINEYKNGQNTDYEDEHTLLDFNKSISHC